MDQQQLVPLELVELIRNKPVATYVILRNNLKLIMSYNNYDVTDEQIDIGLFGLISEIDVKEMRDLDVGEIN